MLSLLIPGPQSPGNDIDVYLQPLIEELKKLWELGVDTYDASKNQTFKIRATLLWTISDYPGYAMLSETLKDFENEFGKKKKKKRDGPWKKKSIFFELPYWAENTLRHNLDVMHIEKNIFDNIIETLLDIPGKTKDHVNARYDLKDMGIRKKLHPKEIGGGRAVIAKSCFSMSAHEKTIFCGVLKAAKLPDGTASNISKCVHISNKKVFGYKSHDAHFMLHYLLQVAVRDTLPNVVAEPLIRLGSFFRALCKKVIQEQDLNFLEAEIADILCQMEMIFPPSFFDIMVHLPIHLANEVRLGGPVQFRWMYPTKRNLCKLKSYVRNRAHPEGSIAEAYLAEEALTFCLRYLHDNVDTRLNRKSQNYDNSDLCDVDLSDYFSCIGRSLGGKKNGKPFFLDSTTKAQAHRYLLFNCDEEHDDIVSSQTKGYRWVKAKTQSHDISEWFKTRALKDDVSIQLQDFSRGPCDTTKMFSGYLINGYRFHTMKRDARRKTQNSGVTLVSLTPSFASSKDENPKIEAVTYYGAIGDIIELDYYSQFRFVLFKCDWFEVEEDKYGLTYVYFNKKSYQNDPFVLPSQVHQCFYVMKTDPRDLYSMGDLSDSMVQESYQSDPFDGELNWVREDIPGTIVDKPPPFMQETRYEDDSDFDNIVL
ncbi:uncharacterized protein LOC127130179 [Lathyrus oleraceus]|uniref:uncharacterized protein LOC127130179 n=1 Tax=Pisum sativum TaxID=3888 RepID=UPI0021CE6171|nr:uncharacterized protein LOC127130179 [Pisum sativum]